MTKYELLLLNRDMLKMLSKHGIYTDDYKYILLYKEYQKMKSENLKTAYIIQILSDKYNMSERTVYRTIRRFNNYCQNVAVE